MEKNAPADRVECDGPGLTQPLGDEDSPSRAVEARHLDAVGPRVGPVQVPCDPVDGEAVRMLHLGAHQRVGVASVQPRTPDRPHLVICPVHVPLHRVVVDGDGVTDVAHLQDHVGEIREVQRDPAQIGPAGQQQNLLRS